MSADADDLVTTVVKTWATAQSAWVDALVQLYARAVEVLDPDDDVVAANEKVVTVALRPAPMQPWVGPLVDAVTGTVIPPSRITVTPTTLPAATGAATTTHADVRVTVAVPAGTAAGVYEGKLYDGADLATPLADVDVMISPASG